MSSHRTLALSTAGVILAILAVGYWGLTRLQAARTHGEALFHGRAPLAGRIAGHTEALPTEVTRCVNCHAAIEQASRQTAFDEGGRYGPALDHDSLTQPRVRRGGPPSRYDAAAFCALLRTGVDPAQVMIPQVMPRYTPDAATCDALWQYLLSR